jgi:hypothetical protein
MDVNPGHGGVNVIVGWQALPSAYIGRALIWYWPSGIFVAIVKVPDRPLKFGTNVVKTGFAVLSIRAYEICVAIAAG